MAFYLEIPDAEGGMGGTVITAFPEADISFDVSAGHDHDGVNSKSVSGSSTNFLALTDTPASFTGGSLKVVRVNVGETALEYAAAGAGDLLADGTVPLTANWDVGAFTITGLSFTSDVATGTAPFTVASTTKVTNLNADQVDGVEGTTLVVGPASSVDNAIVRFDGTTGKLVQDYISGTPTIGDTGAVSLNSLTLTTDLAIADGGTGASDAATALANLGHGSDAHTMTLDGRDVSVDGTKLDGIASGADVTGSNAPQAHAASHADAGADELAVQDLASDTATDGQVAKADGAGATVFEDDVAALEFIIDGGGSAITTGIKGDIEIPFACTINQVTMAADQSGSIVVDIWKDTYANYPPTDADSITASAVPTITTATKSQDSTLTGWTTAIAAGDMLRFNVDSATTIQRLTLSLKVTKT